MESRHETVTGPMLREKQKRFEDEFYVPENERLSGEWLQSFCTAYKICKYRWHGEAESVDIEAVDKVPRLCFLFQQFKCRIHFCCVSLLVYPSL
ncbi:hypothetical protein CY34DRAFT_100001 [Suillus luteus UH-Slu-Lm8-n1]|uniref:Uncharacterized protein n=1 Tax=Suillus luteus UH-Slu-Lm8-n1 TaxID=930992 RepID=A0A0C9Z6S2_9AGAM|nr:hypothetical protein CY34DRAFT_100001 [Suillus luteus UH-Slu-Lm8-n1]